MRFLTFSIFLVFLVTAGSRAIGQEGPLTINQANEAYANHEYLKAARLFEKVAVYRKAPADVPGKLAVCYRELNDHANAALWYKRVTDLSPGSAADWIELGDALKSLGMYPDAKAAYRHVPDSLYNTILNRVAGCDSAVAWMQAPTAFKMTNLSDVNTANSDWGATWYAHHLIVFTSDSTHYDSLDVKFKTGIDKRTGRPFQKSYVMDGSSLGSGAISGFAPVINDNTYHDGAIAFSRQGDTAYFTVTDPGSMKGASHKIKSKEGKRKVIIDFRRLELWWTVKDSSGKWGAPKAFAYNNPQYSVGQAALSPDGRILYFASDMPGGYGKTDIWYTEKLTDTSWSAPVNCGPLVNSSSEEDFPNVGEDGALYFASKGHVGMGGFDVFRAAGEKASFSQVSNMQYPINSPGDDFYFTMKDPLSGFLSSDRQGGKGSDDIYAFSAPDPVPDLVVTLDRPGTDLSLIAMGPLFTPFAPDPSVVLAAIPVPPLAPAKGAKEKRPRGTVSTSGDADPSGPGAPVAKAPLAPKAHILQTLVVDYLSGEPLDGAQVMVSGLSSTETASVVTAKDGLFFKPLEPEAPLLDSAVKDGYSSDRHIISKKEMATFLRNSVPGVAGSSDTLSVLLRLLKKPEVGDVFVLRRLYFDFNKWNIRPDAAIELDRLIIYMRQFPTMTIDLSSHTDSRGDDDYNQTLSEKRAESSRQYLVNHGIKLHRVITHGYGESMLTNGCSNGVPCSEVEHQANRRAEIRIIHQ